MKNYLLLSYLFLLTIAFSGTKALAQSKIILDKQSGGGYCNHHYDLGEYGFILVFNKSKDVDEGVGKDASIQNNYFYYSKDLSKRANFKINTTGQVSFYASKNNIFLIDRLSTKYTIRVLDFTGREIANKKLDIESVGLNQDLISKIHFTTLGKMVFEVYDGHSQLHIYQNNLLNPQDNLVQEIDIALPSANPLQSMKFIGNWSMVGESMGYYILAKKGANAEYDPNAIAYHIAFYDEEFNLFRELLLDNFIMPNEQMLGKEAAFSLNPSLQTFIVSCLINKNGKSGYLVANYGMDPNSSVMRLFWHKEFEIINNEKYKLIENDGLSVPAPPIISHKGPLVTVSVMRGRTNVQEEAVNQLTILDGQGTLLFNAVQNGNFDALNLDNYCVDNDNRYSRIKKLQMAAVLKPYCEKTTCEVLDIDVDQFGNELVIIRDGNINVNQVVIYRFTKK
ncbi:MAG: hypothetical protein CFE21_06860 [Bacteroidetes bacterium B1(2017)]|nr:MAG: hypothetical protein CFE21_06860 [Bacteroidetes bacterium B1(2017)]